MALWVSNTSPLIFLSKLDRLNILQTLVPKLTIPEYVYTEITRKDDLPANVIKKACEDWIQVQDVVDSEKVRIAMADIHRGEAEAIVLAQELKADFLLIDDQDARRFALRCGMKIIGTVGILLVAKKKSLILNIKPELEKLISHNFRINQKFLSRILYEAGEQ